MAQQKAFVGMRQTVMGDQGRNVGDFGLLCSQELFARRNIVEQVAHRDHGPSDLIGFEVKVINGSARVYDQFRFCNTAHIIRLAMNFRAKNVYLSGFVSKSTI